MLNSQYSLKILLATFLLAATIGFSSLSVKADGQTWLNTNLSLQKTEQLPQGVAPPYSISGNRDCQNYRFVTRPKILLQSDQSHLNCGIQTVFGMADPNGWLELNGTQTSGKFISYPGFSAGFIPIPGSSRFINYTSAPQGLYFYFTDFSQNKITVTQNLDRSVNYQFTQPPFAALKDKSGALLQVQPDSMSFSSDGKWMVVDSPGRAILRVNLETLEVLPFAPTFNYSLGINPGLQTAVSSNGRYAVVYSYGFSTFKIYDLTTCGSVPNTISQPVICQSKDLLPIPQAQISNFRGISQIRFATDGLMTFYANNFLVPGNASTNQISKYNLSMGQAPAKTDYLAMGDSFISGEGAYSYRAGTDTSINHCHQSLVSYPNLIGKELDLNSFHSVACSGAVAWDIYNTQDDYKGQVKDKVEASKRDRESILNDYTPGMLPQVEFVKSAQPKAITISIGGNDIGFSTILRRCLEPDTCYGTYEDRVEVVRQINTVLPKLVNTYQKTRDAAPADTRIYAIGYPQLALAQGNCAANVHLNSQEIEFASQLISYLDNIVRIAAERTGVNYIDTQDSLNGHRMCETKTSQVAVNGITAGSDQPDFLGGPIGNETYHPNALGHELLADWVGKSTKDLTEHMLPANPNSALPAENDLGFLNAPKTGRAINALNYDDTMANNVVYRETWLQVSIDSLKFSLKPYSPLFGILHSEPVELGTISANASGGVNGQLFIPSSVAPGMHILHIYGQNVAGENVDIAKPVYVAANQEDYDDDLIQNSLDSCKYVPDSGVDYDQDRVDDTCDGLITDPPVNQPVVLAFQDSSTPSGATSPKMINFRPRVALDQPSPVAEQTDVATSKVLGATVAKTEQKQPSLKSKSSMPTYGLIFLGTASSLGLLVFKRFGRLTG